MDRRRPFCYCRGSRSQNLVGNCINRWELKSAIRFQRTNTASPSNASHRAAARQFMPSPFRLMANKWPSHRGFCLSWSRADHLLGYQSGRKCGDSSFPSRQFPLPIIRRKMSWQLGLKPATSIRSLIPLVFSWQPRLRRTDIIAMFIALDFPLTEHEWSLLRRMPRCSLEHRTMDMLADRSKPSAGSTLSIFFLGVGHLPRPARWHHSFC